MGYQWPASRLTADDMRMLHLLRLETRRPITQLLHEAVQLYYKVFTRDQDHSQEPPEANPESRSDCPGRSP